MSKRLAVHIVLTCLCLFFLLGCMKFALRFSPALLQNFSDTIFEECDPDLARDAIPANLKLMEGLLKADPNNKKILTILSIGFNGYAMLYLENDEPERASQLYLRARRYGIQALGDKGSALENPGTKVEDIKAALAAMGKADFEALFWTTVAWNAWINLNLDKPAAFAQLGASKASLERVLEIDENYLYGFPHILMGTTMAATPPMLGGDAQGAKFHFEKALALADRKFFLAQYYYARYYAPREQDKALFFELLEEITQGEPNSLSDVCLINTVMKSRAGPLQEMADEFFF